MVLMSNVHALEREESGIRVPVVLMSNVLALEREESRIRVPVVLMSNVLALEPPLLYPAIDVVYKSYLINYVGWLGTKYSRLVQLGAA